MTGETEKLSAWGCNVPEALNRFLQDEGLYVKCLHAFTEDKSFGNLEKALNEKDYKQAFEEAHTLKGVSANLSLTPLCEAICKVVEDLRHEKYLTLDDDYSVLKASYAKYLEIMGDKV